MLGDQGYSFIEEQIDELKKGFSYLTDEDFQGNLRESFKRVYDDAYNDGCRDGGLDGHSDGYNEGYEEGYEKGYSEGGKK